MAKTLLSLKNNSGKYSWERENEYATSDPYAARGSARCLPRPQQAELPQEAQAVPF
jgi:hypothetical protein